MSAGVIMFLCLALAESRRFDVSGPQTVQRHDELGPTAGIRGLSPARELTGCRE